MKKLLIISAMLFVVLGLSAQNNRDRSTRERKVAVPEAKKNTSTETRTRSHTTTPAETRTQRSESSRQTSRQGYNRSAPGERDVRHPGNDRRPVTRSVSPSDGNHGDRKNSYRRPAASPGHGRHTTVNREGKITYDPKRGTTYSERRRVYVTPSQHRVVRKAPHVNYVPRPLEYRRVHYPYRMPPRINIVWNERMYREYIVLYPDFHLWYYPFGYRIHTVSSYDVSRYVGEIARVYGQVYESWYSPETDELYLYFGGPYPYHDFSIVLDGRDARKFSRHPQRYFNNRYIAVTGLVSLWEDKPEIVVRKRSQLEAY